MFYNYPIDSNDMYYIFKTKTKKKFEIDFLKQIYEGGNKAGG